MPDLQIILGKKQENLLPDEKTELRRRVRDLTTAQAEKFAKILAESDPNMGEEALLSDINTPEGK